MKEFHVIIGGNAYRTWDQDEISAIFKVFRDYRFPRATYSVMVFTYGEFSAGKIKHYTHRHDW